MDNLSPSELISGIYTAYYMFLSIILTLSFLVLFPFYFFLVWFVFSVNNSRVDAEWKRTKKHKKRSFPVQKNCLTREDRVLWRMTYFIWNSSICLTREKHEHTLFPDTSRVFLMSFTNSWSFARFVIFGA